jgi:hypothetical protein
MAKIRLAFAEGLRDRNLSTMTVLRLLKWDGTRSFSPIMRQGNREGTSFVESTINLSQRGAHLGSEIPGRCLELFVALQP